MFGANDKSRISSGGIPGITLGTVSNVEDPENLGRIKVRLPGFAESYETDWASVVVPMAGSGAGFFFIPVVGDEVVVAFKGGDVNYPYVIGSIWANDQKPPQTSQDAKDNILVIKSRKGHIITIDDKKENCIELRSSSGNRLSLGEDKIHLSDNNGENLLQIDTNGVVSISAASKLELKASEINIIASQSLKISSGKMSIESTTLDVKSGASQSFKTSGILTINGSIVKIN